MQTNCPPWRSVPFTRGLYSPTLSRLFAGVQVICLHCWQCMQARQASSHGMRSPQDPSGAQRQQLPLPGITRFGRSKQLQVAICTGSHGMPLAPLLAHHRVACKTLCRQAECRSSFTCPGGYLRVLCVIFNIWSGQSKTRSLYFDCGVTTWWTGTEPSC